MIALTFFQVSALLTSFIGLFLGIFVYIAGDRTKLSRSWFFLSIMVCLWSAGLFGVVYSTNQQTAWLWQYVLDIGGICIPVLFLNFLLHLMKKEKKLFYLQMVCLVAGASLIALNFTDLFKTGVSPKFGINFWIDPGKLYVLFPLYFAAVVFVCVYVTVKDYLATSDANYKRQLLYVLLAQIFGFGGGMTDFFPQVFNIYPFGNYFVILYVIFISYAALRHHLFNAKVIATELLTFAIWAFLMARTLLSTSIDELLLNGAILFAIIIAGVLLIGSVLREVKQKEQIEKMAKDLERAYAVEKRANEELQNLDKTKNQFLLQTQHDLRSPLSTIRGYCDLLLSGTLGKQPKKTAEVLERIEAVAEDKIRDVNNFLDVTQFRLGKGAVNLKPGVKIFSIISGIAKTLEPKCKEKGIYLKLAKPVQDGVSTIEITADKEKIKSAIFNVVDNAIKYTENGGVNVDLFIDNQKGSVVIEIQDTGIGIEKDKVSSLFEDKFERSHEAQKMASGKGIGLYLSAQIVKYHNGKIFAESEGQGKGTKFVIELPIIQPQNGHDNLKLASVEKPGSAL